MTDGGRLKLRAEDEDDLQVIGAMAQDAIVPLADMVYLQDEGRFVMVMNRFMWERAGETVPTEDEDAPAEAYFRVHGMLSVCNAQSVQVRSIDQQDRGQLLNVLAVTGAPDHVCIEFAGGGTIRIQVSRIMCLLEDLSEPWPTRWRPGHDVPEGDAGGRAPTAP